MNYSEKLTHLRPQPSSKSPRSLLAETESDRGRIIQSAAIRRLQQKTQVYPLETNAAVRSRLTHSLEVQQTGRFLAQTILEKLSQENQLGTLGLTGKETVFTNIVEMSCLMHDVGNPPFGHFGEAAISSWIRAKATSCHLSAAGTPSKLFTDTLLPDLAVFEGNAQGLRIIHQLQNLNLTYSQLAALMKYTRPPYQKKPEPADSNYYRKKKPGFYYSETALVDDIQSHLKIKEGCRFPLVYIMEAADDISYCIADLEDAVDKGILSYRDLKYYLQSVWTEYAGSENTYLTNIIDLASSLSKQEPHRFIVKLRTQLVSDLVDYAADRYLQEHQAVFDGTLDEPLIDGDSDQHLALKTLKTIAIRHVFTSKEKETPELRGHSALMGLLDIYQPLLELETEAFTDIVFKDQEHHFLEQRLFHRLSVKQTAAYKRAVSAIDRKAFSLQEQKDLEWYYRARLLIDYISGMTDHFVMEEFQSLSAI
ncbi:dGTPase [Endozoicomonas sp. OPT23]|uniref:dGTPase n=1 Tax=Endozoicomonas sp. OPT23 TaxID=2072845 RepID=UPI00129A8535|nr:dGTPase [Endozoicomonas sp. OPT23]MRI33689.1 dGTPase [Endozoicomonas sp. OPT23]